MDLDTLEISCTVFDGCKKLGNRNISMLDRIEIGNILQSSVRQLKGMVIHEAGFRKYECQV